MKRLLLFSVVMLTMSVLVKAEDLFFPTKAGTELVYKTFDKNDKSTNKFKYIIKSVNTVGSNTDITYVLESYDPKESLVFNDEITIHKKGDILYFDMSNFVNKAAFQQNGQIPPEVKITGNNMQVPLNPKAGDLLPDASVEMALSMGFLNLKVTALVTNRKVESIEQVTVKSGTYTCYKFTSDVSSSAMGIKSSTKVTEWYAKGIGIVKSESYDKNGKLMSHTELVELKN